MHLTTYNALFRSLAQRHKAIAATPDNHRFLRIFISADPVQKQIDTVEFYNLLRSKLQAPPGQPVLVAQNYQVDFGDNRGDYFTRHLAGAFLVLQIPAKLGDPNARDEAVANCEAIGEQVLAAAIEELRDQHQVYVTLDDCWAEHIGPIGDGHVGVRVNLAWKQNASQELSYNPTHFTP